MQPPTCSSPAGTARLPAVCSALLGGAESGGPMQLRRLAMLASMLMLLCMPCMAQPLPGQPDSPLVPPPSPPPAPPLPPQPPPPPPLTRTCNPSMHNRALRALYQLSGGPNWYNNTNWLSTNTSLCTINVDQIDGSVYRVPVPPGAAHCCWHGVTCCSGLPPCADAEPTQPCCHVLLQNEACDCGAFGGLLDPSAAVGTVTTLNLGSNNLISKMDAVLATLVPLTCTLDFLVLSQNKLPGSLPPDIIHQYTYLNFLSLSSSQLTGTIPVELGRLELLRVMDLADNQLTGTFPTGFCEATTRSPVVDILVGNNRLSGDFDLRYCNNLFTLDISSNRIRSIKNLGDSIFLHIVRWSNNSIAGTIPTALEASPLIVIWAGDSAGNAFTGTIPDFISTFTLLSSMNLASNRLTGTMPDTMFRNLASLNRIDLSDNILSGSLPQAISNAPLQIIRLNANFFHGTIPSEMARFAQPGFTVTLAQNRLFCCGIEYNGTIDIMSYTGINYSMPRLPPFLAQSTEMEYIQIDSDLNGTAGFESWGAMRCPRLSAPYQPISSSSSSSALAAFQLKSSVLDWTLDPQYYMYQGCLCEPGFHIEQVYPPKVRVVPSYACVPDQQGWLDANIWFIAIIILLSLLVAFWLTWIMCYRRSRSSLLQAAVNFRKRVKGEPTSGIISIVNTDIEGYSDMMKQDPSLMTKALNLHNAVIRKARWTTFGYTIEQEGDSYSLCFYEPLDAVMFCLMSQQLLMMQDWPMGLFKEKSQSMMRRQKDGKGFRGLTKSIRSRFSRTKRPSRSNLSSSSSIGGSMTDDSFQGPVTALNPSITTLDHTCFHGLRVRMGISTGVLPQGTAIRSSAVMEMAKLVGDAGSGGQVLMDEATFTLIKERLEELAAVDHKGLNMGKLNQIKPPWWMCWKSNVKKQETEAIVLDMGQYMYSPDKQISGIIQHAPALEKSPTMSRPSEATLPSTSGPAGAAAGPSDRTAGNVPSSLSAGGAPPVSSASAVKGSTSTNAPPPPVSGPLAQEGVIKEGETPSLRLYQILPPVLSGRAKVFGNKLALKEGWVCVDQPYFAAPGAMDAPIGLVEGYLSLPNITMCFCCVDGGKAFAASRRKEAIQVHNIIANVIRNTLRVVKGSYLCRLQDGDLKYMVAFDSPVAALSWCLVTQEALLYAPWPSSVLKYEKFRPEWSTDGVLLFRGPRMKMGVCDGPPKSILPDHLGRADYHGASINQAARFMDAGAHGGQIVCEEATAVNAIRMLSSASEHRLGTGSSALPMVQEGGGATKQLAGVREDGADTTAARGAGASAASSSGGGGAGGGAHAAKGAADGSNRGAPSPTLGTAPSAFQSAAASSLASSAATGPPSRPAFSFLSPVSGFFSSSSAPSPQPAEPRTSNPKQLQQQLDALQVPNALAERVTTAIAEKDVYLTSVKCYRTGVFKFKGNTDNINMVYVIQAALDMRSFPSDPPKGKGNRISEASGLVLSADKVFLPDIALRFKSLYPPIVPPLSTPAGSTAAAPAIAVVPRLASLATIGSFRTMFKSKSTRYQERDLESGGPSNDLDRFKSALAATNTGAGSSAGSGGAADAPQPSSPLGSPSGGSIGQLTSGHPPPPAGYRSRLALSTILSDVSSGGRTTAQATGLTESFLEQSRAGLDPLSPTSPTSPSGDQGEGVRDRTSPEGNVALELVSEVELTPQANSQGLPP